MTDVTKLFVVRTYYSDKPSYPSIPVSYHRTAKGAESAKKTYETRYRAKENYNECLMYEVVVVEVME